jgi:predicted dehydrogenase
MLSLSPAPAKRANEDPYPYRGYFRFKVCGTKDTVGICDMNHIPSPEQVTSKTNCYFDIAEPDFTRPEFAENLGKAYYDFFYESWAEGAPLLVTPEEARNAIRCVELITESARLNKTVEAVNMLPGRKDFII